MNFSAVKFVAWMIRLDFIIFSRRNRGRGWGTREAKKNEGYLFFSPPFLKQL